KAPRRKPPGGSPRKALGGVSTVAWGATALPTSLPYNKPHDNRQPRAPNPPSMEPDPPYPPLDGVLNATQRLPLPPRALRRRRGRRGLLGHVPLWLWPLC